MDLSKFNTENLFNAATGLFEQLGIKLNSNTTSAMTLDSVLKENRGKAPIFDSVREVYFLGIVDNSVFRQSSMFESGYSLETGIDEADRNYDGLMIFAVDLDHRPTRTDLSALTRAFNRISKAMPVALLASYDVDSKAVLSLAISERFKYSQTWREGEKVGKIILLKDINTAKTHAGHERILEDLKRTTDVTTYAQLHTKWLKVLDTKELNKTFFQELANWYFWAVRDSEFPRGADRELVPEQDWNNEPKMREVRNATSVIRLITRLMFVWFLKEKGLVSEKLFDKQYLGTILRFSDDSAYYKAILQNLFFATLNSEMKTREFITDKKYQGKSKHYGIFNVLRYKEEFITPDETLRDLFEPIPFLNGGLFECLDKEKSENGNEPEKRVDGFSGNKKSLLHVPDDLFFAQEEFIDLSGVYDDRKKSNVKVRGLINILDSYKFTIAENTPLEEEIALDPELLGKVFENLLASYNPETKTTARKQTGSFYTPREIVNYMVDESLIAYLKQKLRTESEGFGYIAIDEAQTTMFGNEGRIQQKLELPLTANRWNGKDEELEATIRELFSYSDEANPFNETETEILIKAIDNCKILDPACGSGAFPMGILHRLVHLLGKLDPDNSKWKQWQKQKAIKETEKAFEIGDVKEREDRLIEINKIFTNNADDYGRKLFLIENGIYGVDIQPIAIQIAKLRFFISLIVDQKANQDAKDNLGIRPLPNLETKFVAANTLIGLEAQGGLKPLKVNDLEKALKEVRAKHFGARTRETKKKYRDKDKEIRLEIADLLKQGGIRADIADQIAEWNPYDQNTSASWFDAEYMFGIENGFDIVIGNPPYIEFKNLPRETKNTLKGYKTTRGKYDLYIPFIERPATLLRTRGILCYICPTRFMHRDYGGEIRKFIISGYEIVEIVDFGDQQIFDTATTYTGVFIFRNGYSPKYTFSYSNNVFRRDMLNIPSSKLSENPWYFEDETNESILTLIRKGSQSLESISEGIFQGVATGKDSVFVIDQSTIDNYELELGVLKPFLMGKDIGKYVINWSGKYCIYPYDDNGRVIQETNLKANYPNTYRYLLSMRDELSGREYFDSSSKQWFELWNQRNIARFRKRKIITLDNASKNSFAIDDGRFIGTTTTYSIIVPENTLKLEFVLAILNSTLLTYYHQKNTIPQASGFFRYQATFIKGFPVKIASDELQDVIVKLVEKIIEAKKQDPDADITKLEDRIDELVYQLYGLTDDEIAIVEGRS